MEENRRYFAIGFDDFRKSDFALIQPLMKEWGARATFNRIAVDTFLSDAEKEKLIGLEKDGHEIGDHTWFHQNYIFTDPLVNGQNPDAPEGDQIPFPSNKDMRKDRGDGKNVFGFALDEEIEKKFWFKGDYEKHWPFFKATWGNLTDGECQALREHYAIYRDKTGLLAALDALSNRYLGTVGASEGSWDDEKKQYTGGIFTGAKTSANHEIWERVLEVTERFYKEEFRRDFSFVTWSYPGNFYSPFVFTKEEKQYYDRTCTKLHNYTARFAPTLKDGGERSWNDLLRRYGYTMAHDTMFPSRDDGVEIPMMSKHLILNARYSRKDAILYRTNMTSFYNEIAEDYPEEYFDTGDPKKSKEALMYEKKGSFYRMLEELRHETANGIIHGEVIDSVDSYSERVFLSGIFAYCRKAGIQVIAKKEAFDISFGPGMEEGNLIYNPALLNTAKEFLPDAENVPENPDGYLGDCRVEDTDGETTLLTKGEVSYLHCGVPVGKIRYRVSAKGKGNIRIYGIQNRTRLKAAHEEKLLLAEKKIESTLFTATEIDFEVQNMPEEDYEQITEGLGGKIMAIEIVYSEGLALKEFTLQKQTV